MEGVRASFQELWRFNDGQVFAVAWVRKISTTQYFFYVDTREVSFFFSSFSEQGIVTENTITVVYLMNLNVFPCLFLDEGSSSDIALRPIDSLSSYTASSALEMKLQDFSFQCDNVISPRSAEVEGLCAYESPMRGTGALG